LKVGYVLLDGCADRPNPSLNYTTPLQAAFTPNLDGLALRARLGTVVTVRRGVAPESDIAVFNMLGYSFAEGYPGRGVIEAVGSGLDIEDGDLALRANFASVKGRSIVDRRAGRDLTQDEAQSLADDLNSITLSGGDLEFRSTVSYRGVLLIRAKERISADISNTDPAYSRVGGFGAARKTSSQDSVKRCVPGKSEESKRAASLVNEFTAKSLKVLARSRVNSERVRAGRLPANAVLLRDAGDHLPRLPSFEAKYGMKGIALVDMPAEIGIAKLLGMKIVPVTNRLDMNEKAALFDSELSDGAVVYVHIKGPDEFGHDGDPVGKKKVIEKIDRDFFSKAARRADDVVLGVSCDHATPCTMKMHSSDPVPLLISGASDGVARRFTEQEAKLGSLGLLKGSEVLGRIVAS
jgi:2,3-bisphosphoglycerate-independent phosphoglycerate mutase